MQGLVRFYQTAERLKTTLRHSFLSDPSRQESSAEHSWMVALLAIILSKQVRRKVNELILIKMLIIHDLAEILTGDYHSLDRPKDKSKQELIALKKITKNLPRTVAKEFIKLWQEYENKKTFEAKLAQAVDKVEAVMQHNLSDLSTWDEKDFAVHNKYRDELFYFDPFIRKFKDLIDKMAEHKVSGRKADLY